MLPFCVSACLRLLNRGRVYFLGRQDQKLLDYAVYAFDLVVIDLDQRLDDGV